MRRELTQAAKYGPFDFVKWCILVTNDTPRRYVQIEQGGISVKRFESMSTYVIVLHVKTIVLLNDTLDLRQLVGAYKQKNTTESRFKTSGDTSQTPSVFQNSRKVFKVS